MDDLFTTLRGLADSGTVRAAAPFVTRFKAHLRTNPREVEQQMKNILAPVLRRSITSLQGSAPTEYMEMEVFSYMPLKAKGAPRLAVYIAILQSPDTHRDDFEEKIIAELVVKVRELHLHRVLDDISVNHLQWNSGNIARGAGAEIEAREGEKAHDEKKEGDSDAQ